MAVLVQPCVGTNGNAVTNANATGGDQWNTAAATGAGTTNTYDNAHVIHGNATAIKLHYATVSSTAYEAWKASITATANAFARFYIYRTADPSVAGTRISHMLSGLGVAAAALQVTTGGKLRIINSAGTTVVTSSAALATNAWTRVEWEITGISGATGTITARFYTGANLEGTTPDETITSGAGASVTGTINEVRFGCSTAITQSTAWDAWFSDAAFSDSAALGAFLVTIAPPVATLTASAPVPAVTAGVSVDVPAAAATGAAPVPAVTAGASLPVPVAAFTASALVPTLFTGTAATVNVPLAHMTAPGGPLAVPVPAVTAGVTIVPPVATLSASAPVPAPSAGAVVAVPIATLILAALVPNVAVIQPNLIQFRRSSIDPAHVASVDPLVVYGEPVWDGVTLKIGPVGGAHWNDMVPLTGVYMGPVDPGPSLPAGTEYVWAETDGSGTLIGIAAHIA